MTPARGKLGLNSLERRLVAESTLPEEAATAVWVVNRFPTRVTASATSKGCPASSMKLRARSKGRMTRVEVTNQIVPYRVPSIDGSDLARLQRRHREGTLFG